MSQKNNNVDLGWTNFWLYMIWAVLMWMAMSGCSAGYHLQRAQHHLEVAQRKDPSITHIKKDSIKEVIITPPKETDFVFVDVPGDTVYLTNNEIKIKYKSGKTIHDTTYVNVVCPPDTVVVHHTSTAEVLQVPCTYKEFFKQTLGIGNVMYYIIHTLFAAVAVALLYVKLILPRFPNIFK